MYTHVIRTLLAALGLALLGGSVSSAQTADGGPDPASVRVRIGPLWMNPTISLPNLGIDTNVFNDPPTKTPSRDLTIALQPKTEMWLRLGRTWLSGVVTEDIVWYKKYPTERSANSSYLLGWKAPLNRLVLAGSATWVHSRTRPGFEIDARAQRREPGYNASAEIRGFAKTFIGVRGAWNKVSFDEDAFFEGSSLQEQLDRTNQVVAITLRHDLTPLTSVTFSGSRAKLRYLFSPSRNSDSDEYTVSIRFDPAALLKGSATIGYKVYKPESTDLPDYKGASAAVSLAYTLLGFSRFTLNIERDLDFSYDIDQPYYLRTGASGSIAQQIFGPVDIVFRAGAHRLEYRTRIGLTVPVPDRTDRVRTYGGGIGFRMGQDLRLGFNLDRERRTSALKNREYEGLKYGTSITYGP